MKNKPNGNILLVANYESGVGYAWWLMENFWAVIAENFSSEGRKCYIIYPKVGKLPRVIINAPIEVLEFDYGKRTIQNIKELRNIIVTHRIEAVYLTDRPYVDYLYYLLKSWGVKVIVNHDHGPGERTKPGALKKMLKTLIHRAGLFSCTYYIGVSKFVRNRFIEVACIQASKCFYVHNGIVPIEKDTTDNYYVNKEFNIPKNAVICVTVGRATFYKGIDILIKSADVLINKMKNENIYFLHIGDGPDLNEFKRRVVECGIPKRFIFAGRREDVRRILPFCHIGIQVSHGEAFSLAILEYLSAGLATLAPNNCGNPEAIQDGINGLLFTPMNYQEIATKIGMLAKDTNYALTLGTAGKSNVQTNYDINITNYRLITLLEKLW